ncbi:MAG TPA: ABC transporter ATP-binding protein [Pirellulales bacterium]|jgi:putative ABC transport system ATP-binding protein|nr:ABC transporter ATP-binding protein [Pirellulales bacterium]
MIAFREVTKSYVRGRREVRALDGISLSIERGEFVAIMGPSGSGKSTLLSLAGLLDLPTLGIVAIDGRSTFDLTERQRTLWRRRRIGFVFQFFNLVPTFTIERNVALPLLLDGWSLSRARHEVLVWIDRVGLRSRADHLPEELSGGELQRVAVARALVTAPDIVLADEPTGNLDMLAGDNVMGLISEVARESNRTVVVITHDPRVASRAPRLIRLQDGHVHEGDATPV